MCVPCGCLREPREPGRQRGPARPDRQIPEPADPSKPNRGRRRVSSWRRARGIERAEDTCGMQQSRTSHVRGDPTTRSQRHSFSSQKRVPDGKPLRPPPTLRHGGGSVAPKSRTIRFSRIVDLSQPIGPDTQMFPAYPAPTFTQWTTREVHGFFAESMFFVSHTGTHVGANVPVIENVANLEVLGSSPFLLLALPLNLQGTSGSPVRLVALAE